MVSMHWSRFASAKMMAGFLPPSSSDSFLQYGALRSVMRWAVAVEPVKEINGTSGWPTRASPALGPVPNTTLTTPGGTPAEIHRSASLCNHLLVSKYKEFNAYSKENPGNLCAYRSGSPMHCGCWSPTGLLHQPAHHPGSDGGHLAGFGHHCVAGSDCRRNLPGQKVQGEIPGADQTSYTHNDIVFKKAFSKHETGRVVMPKQTGALTHAHRAADGVAHAAHVVHLAAFGGVVQHG